MNKVISAQSLFNIQDADLSSYKLHLACWNGYEHPLDLFVRSWDQWVGWTQWRGGKDDFNRRLVFSLIRFYPEPNKWLFGGIFEVIERYGNWRETEVGYKVQLVPQHTALIGRLMIDFYRGQGSRGRSFRLETYYKEFTVSEILKKPYDGRDFPGYENINIGFAELEAIVQVQKTDWKTALENVKGVYLISDKMTGQKYVGSAYGEYGIWARWSVYVGTAHGFNDELTVLISKNGFQYARRNFQLTVLEYRPMRTDDAVIINRECFWKEALLTRKFGYNKN